MTSTDRLAQALHYAGQLHGRQNRKVSGAPYLGHLVRVAGTVIEFGADEDESIAALLHDAVEDQGGAKTLDTIRRRFGDRVAEMVDACSDTDQHPKPPWRERKEAFLAQLGEASSSVRLISAADKLDNARSLITAYHAKGEAVWERFRGGRDGTLWYFRRVVEICRKAEKNPLFEELDRAVLELERMVERTVERTVDL